MKVINRRVKVVKRMRQNAKTRLATIKAFVAFCMGELMAKNECNGDFKEASNRTQLCIATLRRLRSGGVTEKVWGDTLLKLGTAVNAKISWEIVPE